MCDKNDAFDIDIGGYSEYLLTIYNRWDGLVFKGDKDGLKNDEINWNGKLNNTGEPCAEGVYFFVFNYKLNTELKPNDVHGTITLIREKE